MLKTATNETRWVALSALSALTGFLISGFFSYNFGDSEVLLLLLFIVSVPYGLIRSVAATGVNPAGHTELEEIHAQPV